MPEETNEVEVEIEVDAIASKKPKKRVKKITVSVIRIQGESALVEWVVDGIIRRAYIPRDSISIDKKVEEDILSEGAPYGASWEKVKIPEITADELAQALRRSGIWTVDDLRKNPNLALSAIQSIYRVGLAALNEFAKSIGKEE